MMNEKDEDEMIYQESLQNIPFVQWLQQKKSNVMSQLYKYVSSINNPPKLFPNEKVIILGRVFESNGVSTDTSDFKDLVLTHYNAYEHILGLIYMVYRTNFQPLPNTSLTSDGGWGCTIRSFQMLLVNSIKKLLDIEDDSLIIRMFLDFYSLRCPFSIHSLFANKNIVSNNVNGTSYLSPSAVCRAYMFVTKKIFTNT